MSAPPKLPAAVREEAFCIAQRRRMLTKLIATLQDDKRQTPNHKALAQDLNVSYSVVRRIIHGDPYKNKHPRDEQRDLFEQVPA